MLSRPSLAQVLAHRASIDARMDALLRDPSPHVARVVAMGLQHEQQHQELLLTDIKHAFWSQPLKPAWRGDLPRPAPAAIAQRVSSLDFCTSRRESCRAHLQLADATKHGTPVSPR